LKAHEAEVLREPNAALWWMLRTAAERTHNLDLADLVHRSMAMAYTGALASSPWQRLVNPSAQVIPHDLLTDGLADYQRFFYHAAVCHPVPLSDGQTSTQSFLTRNMCRPMWSHGLFGDKVCATHQLMGLMLHAQSRCASVDGTPALQDGLLQDITLQLQLDPVVKDGYIQHVLMLMWAAGPDRVKPVWLRHALDAQRPDGGWAGDEQLPGLPDAWQPRMIKQRVGWLPPPADPSNPMPSDLHATAQGILLSALAMQAAQAAKQAASVP